MSGIRALQNNANQKNAVPKGPHFFGAHVKRGCICAMNVGFVSYFDFSCADIILL